MVPSTLNGDEIPILIVGYNRPEMLLERIEEALKTNCQSIFVAIDGGLSDKEIKVQMDRLCQHYSKQPRLNFIRQTSNLGLSKHMVESVNTVLNSYHAIVVIEDDIKVAPNFYSNMVKILTNWNPIYFAVGGFSSLWGSNFFPNRWRESTYVSIWGWGITRENWKKYSITIDKNSFHESLQQSKIWRELSNREKKIWIYRFTKVANNPSFTWDTQIQYASFINNMKNVQSLWRISENVGFNNEVSTNTKGKRPIVYGSESTSSSDIPINNLIQGRLARLIEVLDRFVIVGIYKIPVRKFLRRLQNDSRCVKN